MNFEKFVLYRINTVPAKTQTDQEARRSVNLEIFLEYELQASSRYCRYLSIVMLKSAGNGSSNFKEFLSDCIRTCDTSFAYGNYLAILMGETDEQSSALAINRYRHFIRSKGLKIQFASVTYPRDGKTLEELHRILMGRIEDPNGAKY